MHVKMDTSTFKEIQILNYHSQNISAVNLCTIHIYIYLTTTSWIFVQYILHNKYLCNSLPFWNSFIMAVSTFGYTCSSRRDLFHFFTSSQGPILCKNCWALYGRMPSHIQEWDNLSKTSFSNAHIKTYPFELINKLDFMLHSPYL